jgi:hypothetical protein
MCSAGCTSLISSGQLHPWPSALNTIGAFWDGFLLSLHMCAVVFCFAIGCFAGIGKGVMHQRMQICSPLTSLDYLLIPEANGEVWLLGMRETTDG